MCGSPQGHRWQKSDFKRRMHAGYSKRVQQTAWFATNPDTNGPRVPKGELPLTYAPSPRTPPCPTPPCALTTRVNLEDVTPTMCVR